MGVIIGTGIFVLTGQQAKVNAGRVTGVLVIIKVTVVMFVVVAGLFFIKLANYQPFIPPSKPSTSDSEADEALLQLIFGISPTHFGAYGVIAAASVVFFAHIGFHIVATAAEETKNPEKDIPRGIIGSLIICTVLYIAVLIVITGMLKYSDKRMNTGAPLSQAFSANGADRASKLISLSAVCGLTTVLLVLMLGQARVLFAMSRDGLLPRKLAQVHPKFGTPYVITIVTGVFVAGLAGVVPLSELSKLVSIGTLFAFVLVSAGVIIYFTYGMKHSRLGLGQKRTPTEGAVRTDDSATPPAG